MHILVWEILFIFSEIKKGARKPFNSRQLSGGNNGPFWVKVLTYSDFNLKKNHKKNNNFSIYLRIIDSIHDGTESEFLSYVISSRDLAGAGTTDSPCG